MGVAESASVNAAGAGGACGGGARGFGQDLLVQMAVKQRGQRAAGWSQVTAERGSLAAQQAEDNPVHRTNVKVAGLCSVHVHRSPSAFLICPSNLSSACGA